MQNALQYSLDGSRVHVSLAADGTTAVASVKNTSREEIARNKDFTERFVRGDDARTDGGSGLGLALCSRIAQAHGGTLAMESELGKGTTVTVTLPAPNQTAAELAQEEPV